MYLVYFLNKTFILTKKNSKELKSLGNQAIVYAMSQTKGIRSAAFLIDPFTINMTKCF